MKTLHNIKKQNGLIRKFGRNWALMMNADERVFLIGREVEVELSIYEEGGYQFGYSPYHKPVEVYEWMDKNSKELYQYLK